MRDADGFFWNSWDRLGMHGHGLPPRFIDTLVLHQYLICLPDPALVIRQQYLSVVDHSDFPPPRLIGPSDSPYDQETVPAIPFKQRGFVWPFMCFCSCSCSCSSLWHFFGVLIGSIFRLPPQEERSSIPLSTVSSS
jgi:hypothetical protein